MCGWSGIKHTAMANGNAARNRSHTHHPISTSTSDTIRRSNLATK